MNARIKILSLVAEVLAVCPLAAQTTYEEMEQLTVNEQVTTVSVVIVAATSAAISITVVVITV